MNFHKFYDRLADKRLNALVEPDLPLSKRLALVRENSTNSMAYSTAVQDGLSYFGNSEGYIAYSVKSGYAFALSDPVAPLQLHPALIIDFIKAAKKPTFVQISEGTAQILSDLGWRIQTLGVETELSLSANMFQGSKFQSIRYSLSWLKRNGYQVIDADRHISDTTETSKAWLEGQIVRREMRFANRAYQEELSEGMRRYCLIDPSGVTIAFLDLDPMYKAGKVHGYSTAIKRRSPDASNHAEIGLGMASALALAEEGYQLLSLGLSPLVPSRNSPFQSRPLWTSAMSKAYGSPLINRKIFNVAGHAKFKRRFHGHEISSYMAVGNGSLTEAVALCRLLKLY